MLQASLFGDAPLGCAAFATKPLPLDRSAFVRFEPGWLQGSASVFDQLRDEMAWRAMERPMYDRVVDVPRLICTTATASLASGHPLKRITTELETALGTTFSSIGLNFYRDGNDSVAWHRDSIGRTGIPATVALVSLGSPRTLAMRPYRPDRSNPSKTAETTRSTPATSHRWRLGHGDLFVMGGECQRTWEHSVPKERLVGPRISLAFRCREAVEGPRIGGAGVPPL